MDYLTIKVIHILSSVLMAAEMGPGLVVLMAAVADVVLGLVFWIMRSSASEATALKKVRRTKPDPDADKKNTIGMPRRDPWMG